jgi:hypothetical protein
LTIDPAPESPSPLDHPVRLRVAEGLARNRLTVFFRLLLAIPHLIWLGLWSLFAFLFAIINWFAVLITGQTPAGLHRFLTSFINYATHVQAYLSIAANRYPGFVGDPGYEVDVVFDPPAKQNRWTVLFRIFLAIPAGLLAAVLVGSYSFSRYSSSTSGSSASTDAGFQIVSVLATAAVIAWFYSLVRGRAPEGVARLSWYAIHYGAQFYAYLFVLTDRYPNSDPRLLGVPRRPPPHPIALAEQEDPLARTRLTVFFRLLLAFPHFVWLILWTVVVFVVAIVNWFATLFTGRSPAAIHRFLASYVRYSIHVQAFVTLVANPFPGFAGAAGSYPVDVVIAPPERQNRWATAFRVILAIPALFIQSALNSALYVVAILGWFASLFTARMPRGLRNLGAFALRYSAQTSAYAYLLTDRYPYAGPPAGDVPEVVVEPPATPEPVLL